MKTYIKYTLFWIALIAVSGIFTTSCQEDDDDNGAQPVIHYIRTTDPNASDSLLAGGFLGNMIAIVGEGLSGARLVCFNDQCVYPNPTYVTDKTIIVSIPSAAPGEVDNLLKIVFNNDTFISYPFKIDIAGPEVISMKSEYVNTGDVAVIQGDFFFEPMTVLFAGGVEGEIVSVTQSAIEVRVPDGAEPGPITVTTNFGEAISTFWFRDNRFVFGHFDAPTDGWWHGPQYLTPVPEIPPVDNLYVHFTGQIVDAGSWLEFYVGPAAGGIAEQTRNIPDDAILNPERYEMKFELLTLAPIATGANIKIYIGNNMEGQRGSNWYNFALTADTEGEWQTIAIPFGEVIKEIKERSSPPISINVDPNGYGLSFWFHDSSAAMPLDFAIDNIRVSPIQ
jgi:hypothetical protein